MDDLESIAAVLKPRRRRIARPSWWCYASPFLGMISASVASLAVMVLTVLGRLEAAYALGILALLGLLWWLALVVLLGGGKKKFKIRRR